MAKNPMPTPRCVGSALRQTQIAFFAEISESPPECDVVVLDVCTAPPPTPSTPARGDLGSLQRAIMNYLLNAPTMGGVFDLREIRRSMLRSHSASSISRAFRTLLDGDYIEAMVLTPAGFEPDVGGEGPARFVRCAGGS